MVDQTLHEVDGARLEPRWWTPVLDRTERLIFDAPLWAWLAVLGGLVVVKDGGVTCPEVKTWQQIARAFPGNAHLSAQHEYMSSSPVIPAIAHVLHATGTVPYAVLSVLVTLAAGGVLVVGLWRRGGRVAVGVGTVALFASPLSTDLMTQIGKQDPVTVAAIAAMALFDSPLVGALAGILLGVAHPEVGVVTVALMAALILVGRDPTYRLGVAIAVIVGFMAGLAGNAVYGAHAGVPIWSRESTASGYSKSALIDDYLGEWPALVWSVFGAWWLFLGLTFRRLGTGRARTILMVAVVLSGLMVAGTYDETRVWGLLTWLVVLTTVLWAVKTLSASSLRRATSVTFLAAVAIPPITIYAGVPIISKLGDIISRV
jgi:hypothetical protein